MHDDGNEGKRWLFTMKKLKGVIVGCGGIAREHLAAVADLPNVEIAALCDISAARAEAMAERFGIAAWYTSYEELLANVRPDLVHITTTPSAHFPIARACLSSGLNVLCEKPITIDYSEFCVLKQLALSQNCILMENQNFRFHSSVRRVFDLFEAGKLGDILDVQVCISLNIFSSEKSLHRPKYSSFNFGATWGRYWRFSHPYCLLGLYVYRSRRRSANDMVKAQGWFATSNGRIPRRHKRRARNRVCLIQRQRPTRWILG